MTDPTIEYQGWYVTDNYLSVTFTHGASGVKRFLEVKVPMFTLATSRGFLETLNSAAARALRAHWELDEPMILVPDDEEEF